MGNWELFGKRLSGPFTIPSGIVTTDVPILQRIAEDIPEIGILTTKSIGPEPRAGYREPILARCAPQTFINAVGLTNPGAAEAAKKLAKLRLPDDRFLLVSIFGGDAAEFRAVAEQLLPYADGFELNLSCPHAGKYGQTICENPQLVEDVTRAVATLGKPTVVKVSPNVDVPAMVQWCIRGGAAGLTLINTRGPEQFSHDGHPVLANTMGGISGKAILDLGVQCVAKARRMTDIPIIACGGIYTAEDIGKYQAAGANFFGVGSALYGMDTPAIQQYFRALSADLLKGTNTAAQLLHDDADMQYRKFQVVENQQLAPNLFLIRFDGTIKTLPGQFVFPWLPGKGEKPFSIFDDDPLTLLVHTMGEFTTALGNARKGDTVYIRGPYGNSPQIKGRALLVGGGTGIAALYLFAKRYPNTIALLGGRDKSHIAYLEQFQTACAEVHVATDNGSLGHHGLVTEPLPELLASSKPASAFNCGPPRMVEAAVQQQLRFLPQEQIYASIDFLTKCGVGICGSCTTPKGYRSCVDGTFLKPWQMF